MNLIQLAGMLPRDPLFREYVRVQLSRIVPLNSITVDEAEEYIRVICQIASRRELATNAEAAHFFETLLRRPFIDWRDNQQHNERRAA